MTGTIAIAIHGGAGANPKFDYTETQVHMTMLVEQAKGWLIGGMAALDAVERAVAELEASGLYVAGRGAAPNRAGIHEFDACIMDGSARKAGAVAAIRNVISPIAAARAVMEHTDHVLLAGDGATQFAHAEGLPAIPDAKTWFRMPVGVTQADIDSGARAHGTVGAVALDSEGRLAAATSTGGTWGKRPGRVGDTPIPGAGTWADAHVAASCTGIGEAFILAGGAGYLAARMELVGDSVQDAASALLDRVAMAGGDGGVIALTRQGAITMPYNSAGMKRAAAGNRMETLVRTFCP